MDITRVKESTADGADKTKAGPTPRHSKRFGVIVVILIVFGLVIGSIFAAGYYYGKSVAEKNKKEQPDNFLTRLGNTISFASPSTGEVQQVDRMSISIIGSEGKPKQYSLNDATRVTKQNTTLNLSDVKKGQQVTLFTTGSEENPTVTRIILR